MIACYPKAALRLPSMFNRLLPVFVLLWLSTTSLIAQNNISVLQNPQSLDIQGVPSTPIGPLQGLNGGSLAPNALGAFYTSNCNFTFNMDVTDVSCAGGSDGSIQANLVNGTGPFSFVWTGPNGFSSSSQNIGNLSAGGYMVAITDGNSCTDTINLVVGTQADMVPPLLIGVPADDTLDCSDTIPPDPVIVTDNCPGVQVFTTNSVSSFECSPGLASWWPAEGNANDAQGSLNASLINGTTFSSGIAGDAFALDGLNDYIEVNDTLRFAADNYSVAIWFKTEDTARNQTIFAATDTLNGLPGIQVDVDSNGVASFLHRFPFGSSGGTTISSGPGLNDGNWHQLVALKSDTIMRLYIDNVLQGTAVDLTDIDEPLRITIGRLSFLNFSDNQFFKGSLDENRVYSKALCDEEIKGLYLAGIQNNTWAPTFRLTRTWTAIDASGNFATANQEMVFVDRTPPELTVPQPIVLQCQGGGGVPITDAQVQSWLNSAMASDECTCVILTYTAPSFLPAGCGVGSTTLITFSVTDECGNLTVGSSSITVVDTVGPNLNCQDIVVQANDNTCQTPVNYNMSSVDECSGDSAMVNYSIPSGSMFAVGSTQVTATATDSCGNTSSCSFDVTVNPLPLTVQTSSPTFACGTHVSCNGGTNGSALATPAGGCAPYSYMWSNGGAAASIGGLGAGSYTVTVVDANGTSATSTVVLTEPSPLTATVVEQPYDCNTGNMGSLDLLVNGGASCQAYSYAWTGPNGFSATTEDLTGLEPGVYSVIVTDANGCMVSTLGTVSIVNTVTASISCCQDSLIQPGDTLGIEIELEGSAPWDITYSDGSGTHTVTVYSSPYTLYVCPLSTTTYTLTGVTNDMGCPGTVCGSATVAVDNGCSLEVATCPFVIDFNTDGYGSALPAGTQLANQYSNLGFTISASNNRPGHPDKAITFDSSNPTGGDTDLGTPNVAFGGPGIGAGGGLGQPGENNTALGNLVIVAEDDVDANNDGLVDDPDDEAQGGTITIDFNGPVNLDYIKLVDLDDGSGGSVISCLTPSGTVSVPIPNLGDNAVKRIDLNQQNVTQLNICFAGSGALAEFAYCPVCLDTAAQSCMSASVASVVENQSCRTVEIDIDCNGPCADSLDFIDLNIGCGTLDTAFTSTGLQVIAIQEDPISGLTGIRVQNPVTCADTGHNFRLTYTVCQSGPCTAPFCAPLMAFGGGSCVEYVVPGNGTNLKQVENEVDVETVLEDQVSTLLVQSMPNPTAGPATVLIEAVGQSDAQVLVTGLAGQVVLKQVIHLDNGKGLLDLDLSGHSAGIYMVDVRVGTERVVQKLVRQ